MQASMIKCPGTFQNALGTFRNAITYATLRRAPRGRPDLAGCLALCHLCRRTCASQTICWDMSSSRRELALGADVGCLVLSWNHSKWTPCLLVRHKYRHTNHHAAASLPFKFVPAPLGVVGVTHDTNATRPTTSTTAPPCPPPTRFTGGPTRAVACEAEYFFRVVVVASSSVVRLGNTGTT